MSIKNILIHVDDSEQVDGRLDVAVGLAQTHDAHLAAIYAIPTPSSRSMLATVTSRPT